MKYLTAFAAAAFLVSASPSVQAYDVAANPDSWPSCLGQACCELISELPISERSAFRARHAYCQREERDGDRRELIELKIAV